MSIIKRMKLLCVSAFAACVLVGAAFAQSPYGWRGVHRDGVYEETGLLKEWPADGPELLWSTLDVGKGHTSPVFVGDRFYITGMNEDETMEIFSAYTLAGKKVYEVAYSPVWSGSYQETRTTPMIVGNKAYMISGSGEVVCLDITNGKTVWKVSGKTFQHKPGMWGTSECPLVIDGKKVIYTPSGEQTTLVALDAETGKTIWKTRSLGDEGGYASPILITHNGRKQIVALTGNYILGVDPDTGAIDWTFDDLGKEGSQYIVPTNTPLYKDGRIFTANGYGMGAFMLQLNPDAKGVRLVWRNKRFDPHHGCFVLADGIIYGSNHGRSGVGKWMAIDWNTGETKYETAWGKGVGEGSVIMAGGMLYCSDERRGMVGLVRPNPTKFDLVSSFRITKGEGAFWAHPVIHKGVLYVRHGSALMAYKVTR